MDKLKADLFDRILTDKGLMHPSYRELYQKTVQRCQEYLKTLTTTSQEEYDAESRKVGEKLYNQKLENIDSQIKTLQDGISFLQQIMPQSKYIASIRKVIKMYTYQLESLEKARAAVKLEPYIRRKDIKSRITDIQTELDNAKQKLDRLDKELPQITSIQRDLSLLFLEEDSNV